MGFGYIIAGFFLLVNPIIHVIDLLPDALGFFLIARGLTKLAYMNGRLATARTTFLKLAVVELVRLLCIFTLPFTDDTMLLLFAFVFGVIELILLLPGVAELFEGLNHVGMKYESSAVFASFRRKGLRGVRVIERGTRAKQFTVVFYVLRVIATVLPELTALQMYENLGVVSRYAVDYRNFKPLFYMLLGLIVLIVGIVWLFSLCRYFGGIRKETCFIQNLKKAYNDDICVKTGLFTGKRMKTVLMLFVFAAALSFGLYVDGVNILPGILSSSLLVWAAVLLGRDVKAAYGVIPLCVVRSVLSVVGVMTQKIYFLDNRWGITNDKGETAYHHIEEAREMYNGMFGMMVAEYLAAFAAFALFAYALMKAVKLHLSVSGITTYGMQYSKENRDRDMARVIGQRVWVNMILALVNFALAGGYLMLMLTFPTIFVVNTAVTVLWVIQTCNLISVANELIYTPLVNEEI